MMNEKFIETLATSIFYLKRNLFWFLLPAQAKANWEEQL